MTTTKSGPFAITGERAEYYGDDQQIIQPGPPDSTLPAICVATSDLRPAPENNKIYRPVGSDSAIHDLAGSIREHGVLEPLVISEDGYVISGHRRLAAAKLAGIEEVPVRVVSCRRGDDLDGFLQLLREHNRQRVKTRSEQAREAVLDVNPEDAYQELLAYRRQNSDLSGFSTLTAVDMDPARKKRCRISAAKQPMLAAVLKVLEERSEFWPLSDRQVHYALLNDPPLRHTSKPGSAYKNDRASYGDLCDLLTRARLTGEIPWHAIGDETRPVVTNAGFNDTGQYMDWELEALFKLYSRNLQQSQPNHVEIVGEKLTIRGIVAPVAAEFCIPLTIGRGYCSIQPRYELAQRFRASGGEKLILLVLSDFDPDGENIAESFARSLRDDFGIKSVEPRKVAITAEQVRAMGLPPQMKAKKGSSSYARFKAKHGDNVFELEAIPPADLQRLLREAIESVIDRDAFNAEVEAEKEDAGFLVVQRQQVLSAIFPATEGFSHD